jgi:bifunctional non-homologous end joining protein LigD
VALTREPMPRDLVPMLTTLRKEPPADEGWAFEMKWDGVRALVAVQGGRVSIASRNRLDITVAYPEVAGSAAQLGKTEALLDGEIVRLDARGRPDFGALQKRMHVSSADAARRLADTDPVVFFAFDLLYLDGRSLLTSPYTERRRALESLGLDGPAWQVPPAFEGAGEAAFEASRARGLEGVVAKRLGSAYHPGKRTGEWIKVKNVLAQEVVIGGWRPGKGRRADTIGSLLLGIPGAGGLVYAGQVGTGFTDEMLRDLLSQLQRSERKTSPFDPEVPRADARQAHWVTPKLVGEVAFTEWTPDGRLRHPSWRGLRPDKSADQVQRET